MAANLAQVYAITQDAVFQHRVRAAMFYVAREVLADTSSPVNGVRWALAQGALMNPDANVIRFVNSLATDPAISLAESTTTGSSTDGQLVAATESVWDYLAKASGGQAFAG